jgi:pyrroloquinoline-quinone synthase
MSDETLLSPAELKGALLDIGPQRYHHRHPFHVMMHEGKLTRRQLQAWALNRYYYQSHIPIKDAIVLSHSTDTGFRRAWSKRLADHDGLAEGPGGIEKWIRLAEATGLDRALVVSERQILPGVRYAVEAYIDLVATRSLLEAVASSLTELFSRDLISLRIDALRQHYPWLEPGLMYFTARLTQAPEDAAFALDYVTRNAGTRAEQELAMNALRSKCDILWAQLDAIYFAYVSPGWEPPGVLIGDAE